MASGSYIKARDTPELRSNNRWIAAKCWGVAILFFFPGAFGNPHGAASSAFIIITIIISSSSMATRPHLAVHRSGLVTGSQRSHNNSRANKPRANLDRFLSDVTVQKP
ncbi:hypothetical protein CPSG_03098 [Coccidioides posadasii str. Silveira]|uniref:Uncharacterized protein n=1 Tax=Coccidioides posadasii (strain RMSCC 757 / Silveira) TaxID=443226 RepID=E9D0R9_COCPS|nr:hypothetical protein CPSG_03098 [Coccidioides posadasii str. Silveira]